MDIEVNSMSYDKVVYETFTIDSIRVCNNHYASVFYSLVHVSFNKCNSFLKIKLNLNLVFNDLIDPFLGKSASE